MGSFRRMKTDQKFLSIDFDSWSELSGSLMAFKKFIQENQVPNATIQEYVWLIEKCDEDQFSPCILLQSIL